MIYAAPQSWQYLQGDVPTIQSLVSVFNNVVVAIGAFVGVVLFVMLTIGGFAYLLSGGDQKKLEKAKGAISGAIGGLVFLVCGFLIIRIIEKVTGVSGLTTFTIPQQ